MYKAIKCVVPVNKMKYQQAKALLKPFRETLSILIAKMDRIFLSGETISTFSPYKPSDLNSKLSARQLQTAYAQAKGAFDSWTALLQIEVRSLISNSSLDDHSKIVLYRINARQGWHKKQMTLPWIEKDGKLIPCKKIDKGHIMVDVSAEHLSLARTIVKRAKKQRRRPNLSKVNTLVMDAKVAKLESGKNSFPYWLKLSTMTKGRPIYLPLSANPFMEAEKAKGTMLNFVQVSFSENDTLSIAPVIEQADADERTDGRVIGLDWGITSLFGTSDGQLLGTM